MLEEACLGEDRLELPRRPEALSLLRLFAVPIGQNVVKQEDERAGFRFSS